MMKCLFAIIFLFRFILQTAEKERNSKMKKEATLEGKAITKNSVKRMIFSLAAIAIEVILVFSLLTKLYNVAAWIEVVLRLLGLVLVLVIYGMDMTSSMKMPWIILILILPILGTVLYLLVGLNGGTRKMRQISFTPNCLVERNWLSSGGSEIAL